ncbi:hypothetical protein [Croceitalea dokdonensis]|nr:hypothetical protein [Croceitalea dokdonensis]
MRKFFQRFCTKMALVKIKPKETRRFSIQLLPPPESGDGNQ